MNRKKQRLDLSVYKRGLAPSRQRARTLVMAGKILVNRQPIDKPGAVISDDDVIELKGTDIPYVSRGGLKLAEALAEFNLDVTDLVCLDVGASTGGFTDCLLQHGALRVYAVDVGYGQLAWKLRQDKRVILIERTNIRHMARNVIGEPIALVTVDVSFISLKIVIPATIPFMAAGADIIALIKPQFEVGKGKVGKGGIVSDPDLHREVIEDLSGFFTDLGLSVVAMISSPIRGAKGNKEFLVHLKNRVSKS